MGEEENHDKDNKPNITKEKIWLFFSKDIGFGYLWIAFISLLIMQDMYVATQIFSIPLGLFLENYLYFLSNINFLVLIAILPFFYAMIIFYIPRLSDQIARSLWDNCKSTYILPIFVLFFVLQICYFSILDLLNRFSFVHFLSSNIYAGLLPLIIIISIFNGFILYYRVKFLVYIFFGALFFIIAGFLHSKQLTVIGIVSVLLYIISQIYHLPYTNMEKTKDNRNKNISVSLLLIVVLSYIIIGMTYINYDEWKTKKLTTNPTFGIINKAFFVKNQKDLLIDESDVADKNISKIEHFSDDNNVMYIPISGSMRWYFQEHNSSTISLYGVEEKVSTSDPSTTWHILKFVSEFNITK